MSYQYYILKDQPIGFWPLNETSGNVAFDRSGSGNNSTYSNRDSLGLPLVSGGSQATLISGSSSIEYFINNDYSGVEKNTPFGTVYNVDNDFSLELWYQPISYTDLEYLFLMYDSENEIGLVANKNNIEFRVKDSIVSYDIKNLNELYHVVATYNGNAINLYVNGAASDFSSVDTSLILNEDLTLITSSENGGSFLFDAPSVYRYSLSESQINSHYLVNVGTLPIHVVGPDQGMLIEVDDSDINTEFKYTYPANKSWSFFANNDIFYDKIKESLYLRYLDSPDPVSAEINDIIYIPDFILETANYSLIEWSGDNGVSVEVSIDGETYYECTSGSPIPLYTKESFSTETNLLIRITLNTPNISKFSPVLE
ncbi:MAG: hypothetical protein RLZZ546_965, partial [Bacteroidota bacterium]